MSDRLKVILWLLVLMAIGLFPFGYNVYKINRNITRCVEMGGVHTVLPDASVRCSFQHLDGSYNEIIWH